MGSAGATSNSPKFDLYLHKLQSFFSVGKMKIFDFFFFKNH